MPLLKQGAQPLPQFTRRNKDDRQCPSCGGRMVRRSRRCLKCARTRPEIEQPSDPSIRHIALTKGQVAIVSSHRYEYLNQWLWAAWWSRHARSFYAVRNFLIDGKWKPILMHRFILNAPAGMEVDHVNHNGLDNRDENIRIATTAQNQQNRAFQGRCASGLKGVALVRRHGRENRFRAEIHVNGKRVVGSLVKDKNVAHEQYKEMARKYFGEFACFD